MLNCFSHFCATWRAINAPDGAKLRKQTCNYGFQNDAFNDVDSVRDAKYHYLKFLLVSFSCRALVERIFLLFHDFQHFKNFSFCAIRRAYGAPGVAKTEIFQHGKKLFFVKNNFFLAIYRSESFTNVNYG